VAQPSAVEELELVIWLVELDLLGIFGGDQQQVDEMMMMRQFEMIRDKFLISQNPKQDSCLGHIICLVRIRGSRKVGIKLF
jgi:hypothetical protein